MKKIFLIILCILPHIVYAEKLTVLLDWFPNPNHAPLFIAQQQGFFQQQGLEVELIGPSDPADPPKLVAAGKADIGITYQSDFLQQVEQGLPLVWVGTLIKQPLNALVVLKQSNIKSIADLKGKRIGYSSNGSNNMMLKIMLKHSGLNMSDIISINTHYDLTQALLSSRVDAVTGMMRNFELTQMELAGRPGRAFYPEQNGLPNYAELIFITTKAQARDLKIKKFLIAVTQGVEYLNKHPEETWTQFAKSHPESNNTLNHRAWLETLPYFTKRPYDLNTEEFMLFSHFMQQNGFIRKVHPLADYLY